jgi:hypothetical protein
MGFWVVLGIIVGLASIVDILTRSVCRVIAYWKKPCLDELSKSIAPEIIVNNEVSTLRYRGVPSQAFSYIQHRFPYPRQTLGALPITIPTDAESHSVSRRPGWRHFLAPDAAEESAMALVLQYLEQTATVGSITNTVLLRVF